MDKRNIIQEFIAGTREWYEQIRLPGVEKYLPCLMCGIIPNDLMTLATALTREKEVREEPQKSDKSLQDFEPQYSCRFHPNDGFHEVGCSHLDWRVDQLQEALDLAKQSNAYLKYKLYATIP